MQVLQEKFKDDVQSIRLAEEEHKDGGKHFHVCMTFHKKKNIKDPRAFDVAGFHPNIINLKKKANIERWKRYISKTHKFWTTESLDVTKPDNFRNRKMDYDAWLEYTRPTEMVPFKYPFECFELKDGTLYNFDYPKLEINGRIFDKPDLERKSLWFWGEPGIGKSKQLQKALQKFEICERNPDKGNHLYEAYKGERLIWSDDQHQSCPLTQQEICQMTEEVLPGRKKPVAGVVRYHQLYLKASCSFLVITNRRPRELERQAWFKRRFRVLHVRRDQYLEDASWNYDVHTLEECTLSCEEEANKMDLEFGPSVAIDNDVQL